MTKAYKGLFVIKNKWSCTVFEHTYDALNCSFGIYIFVHIYKTFEYNDGFVELPIYNLMCVFVWALYY